jgi:hypothetical protein
LSNAVSQLPFHTTESEKRIIRELLVTFELRNLEKGASLIDINSKALTDGRINTATKFIAYLKENLFPTETKLIQKRGDFLKPLQADALRVHFDQTLETATLALNAKIRNAVEYRLLLEKLNAFDFEAWVRHCETERSDAD